MATTGGGGGGGMLLPLFRWRPGFGTNGEDTSEPFRSLDVGLATVDGAGAAGVGVAIVDGAGAASVALALVDGVDAGGVGIAPVDWAVAVADDAPAMRAVVARRMRSFMVVHQSKDRAEDPSCGPEAARGMTRRPCGVSYHPSPGPILQPLYTDLHARLVCAEDRR
jgi:hypothetical protein